MRRIDLNANNRITYDEFCEAFSPIHMRVDLRNFKKHTHHGSKSPFKQKKDLWVHTSPIRNTSHSKLHSSFKKYNSSSSSSSSSATIEDSHGWHGHKNVTFEKRPHTAYNRKGRHTFNDDDFEIKEKDGVRAKGLWKNKDGTHKWHHLKIVKYHQKTDSFEAYWERNG